MDAKLGTTFVILRSSIWSYCDAIYQWWLCFMNGSDGYRQRINSLLLNHHHCMMLGTATVTLVCRHLSFSGVSLYSSNVCVRSSGLISNCQNNTMANLRVLYVL
jgi:hypothetical protein